MLEFVRIESYDVSFSVHSLVFNLLCFCVQLFMLVTYEEFGISL